MEEKTVETRLEDHPLAGLLPLFDQARLEQLAVSIKRRGLRRPIVLYEGKILDGRNRYRACLLAKVKPRFENFNGDQDPVEFVWDENIERRDLNITERILAISKFEALPRGNPAGATARSLVPFPRKTTAQRARDAGVSARSVQRGRKLLKEGSPEQIAAVEQGEKSVRAAVDEIEQAQKIEAAEEKDKIGYPIPREILPDWYRAAAWAKQIIALVSDARELLRVGLEKQDPILREITNTSLGDLGNAYHNLKRVLPYAVCTSCQGKLRDRCNFCKGRGYISQFSWDTLVPAEVKAIRERSVAQ